MSARSIKKFLLLACVPVLGIIVGGGTMRLLKTNTPRRQTASLPMPGLGKHLAPLQVQILTPDSLPNTDDQEVEITGYITVNQAAPPELSYEWILPEGVELVDGIQSDTWSGVGPGKTAVTKISVRGFSKEQRRLLTLESFFQRGQTRIGNTAVISSRPEDSMEFVAPDKVRAKAAFDAQKNIPQVTGEIVQ